MVKKGKPLERETDSFLIEAQNNVIRTDYVKAKLDKTLENNKYRLCGGRDGTINHIISKCSKLAQKEYKITHDWVWYVIHWELCKKTEIWPYSQIVYARTSNLS